MEQVQDTATVQTAPGESFFVRHWQKLVAAAIWGGVILALGWFGRANDLAPSELVLRVLNWMQANPWAPLVYLLVYLLRPLTFFSATLLSIAGGFLFGPFWGIVYTVIAANASAAVAYLIGRTLGRGVLEGEQSEGLMQRYANRMRANSFATVLIMRFIFLPYDLVSYLSGFLHIRFWPFLLATALGSIPGTISFVLLGAAASPQEIEQLFVTGQPPSLDVRVLAISAAMFVGSLILARIFRSREAQTEP
jgi:uncharacterized membrane protein YdjX (TVP38/TMEM64 family)